MKALSSADAGRRPRCCCFRSSETVLSAVASFDFADRRVVVTGGSKGIGLGIARRFVEAGAHVMICARGEEALQSAVEELKPHGTIHGFCCDLGDPAAIEQFLTRSAAMLGGIDILISNVSAIARGGSVEAWGTAIAVDLLGTVRICEAATPWLEAGREPAIVHISSITAFRASATAPAYAAIKAALLNYTRSQALALIAKGIRVNGVAPGSTEAPGHFWEDRRLSSDPAYLKALATQPTGRMGCPDDIADVVLFLASNAARWVIGQTIIADGGQFANGG